MLNFLILILTSLILTAATPSPKTALTSHTHALSWGEPFAVQYKSPAAYLHAVDTISARSNGGHVAVMNRDSQPMEFLVYVTVAGQQTKTLLGDAGLDCLRVEPGAVAVFGNVRGDAEDVGYTGNLRARRCGEDGKCWSEEKKSNLLEWTVEGRKRLVVNQSIGTPPFFLA